MTGGSGEGTGVGTGEGTGVGFGGVKKGTASTINAKLHQLPLQRPLQ